MNKQSLIIIMLVCLSFMAAIHLLVSSSPAAEKPATFDDCPAESRMDIHVTATYSFTYCMDARAVVGTNPSRTAVD